MKLPHIKRNRCCLATGQPCMKMLSGSSIAHDKRGKRARDGICVRVWGRHLKDFLDEDYSI